MKLHQSFEDLPGIFTIAGDNLITCRGNTLQEAAENHDRNLAKVLDHCSDENIKLKIENSQAIRDCLTTY